MSEPARAKPHLRVVLCAPRGFCAGVVRAIDVVERALDVYGPPVYVRHEIVHNRFVVEQLKAKGVVFIDELSEAPAGPQPVIFSAHGVSRAVIEEARARNLFAIDATCPLVTKVHREAQAHFKRGRRIILIGHAGHPEVIGTIGQLPPGAVTLVSSIEEVGRLELDDGRPIAFVTQTTLSVDDTREIVAALMSRFPAIHAPPNEDICYATTNRQEAIKATARQVKAVIVVGAANSSNAQRLREVADREGCAAQLVADADGVDWASLEGVDSVAVTAGASAPEALVERVLEALRARYDVALETLTTTRESMAFPLPRELRAPAREAADSEPATTFRQ
jgi:4-hydroxy-3-methylbut-2-enyl diphosphate reductase